METESLDRELVIFEGPSDALLPHTPREAEFFRDLREQYVKAGLIPDSPPASGNREQPR